MSPDPLPLDALGYVDVEAFPDGDPDVVLEPDLVLGLQDALRADPQPALDDEAWSSLLDGALQGDHPESGVDLVGEPWDVEVEDAESFTAEPFTAEPFPVDPADESDAGTDPEVDPDPGPDPDAGDDWSPLEPDDPTFGDATLDDPTLEDATFDDPTFDDPTLDGFEGDDLDPDLDGDGDVDGDDWGLGTHPT